MWQQGNGKFSETNPHVINLYQMVRKAEQLLKNKEQAITTSAVKFQCSMHHAEWQRSGGKALLQGSDCPTL